MSDWDYEIRPTKKKSKNFAMFAFMGMGRVRSDFDSASGAGDHLHDTLSSEHTRKVNGCLSGTVKIIEKANSSWYSVKTIGERGEGRSETYYLHPDTKVTVRHMNGRFFSGTLREIAEWL